MEGRALVVVVLVLLYVCAPATRSGGAAAAKPRPVCRRAGTGVGLALGTLLALTACGTAAPPTTAGGTGGAERVSHAIRVRYESTGGGGDVGDSPTLTEVIVDGERFRMTQRDGAEPDRVVYVAVWDGRDLLLGEPGAGPPERLEGAPAEERPGPWVMRAGDAGFAAACPKATLIGKRTVIGRTGTAYSCPARRLDDMDLEQSEITLDDATGLVLERGSAEGRTVAVEVTTGVAVDASTFSTDLPSDAAAAEPAPLSSVESLPRVGGGELRLAEVTHGPSLVVIGDREGLARVLADVMPLTHQGTRPRTFGLLSAVPPEDWKGSLLDPEDEKRFVDEVSQSAGTMPVPVGIDIKGGVAGERLRSFEQIMDGTTVIVALDLGGALALQVTEDELAASPRALTDWIASNS